MNEDPEALNYDPGHKIIRSPYNGSDGPDMSVDGQRSYNYSPGMARYGLPHYDIPGITQIEDLKDPTLARRMGEAMSRRMSRGDVVANLAVTSLVTNAYLLTGEEKYRSWVLEYTDAWIERAHQNDGLLPDNVGCPVRSANILREIGTADSTGGLGPTGFTMSRWQHWLQHLTLTC